MENIEVVDEAKLNEDINAVLEGREQGMGKFNSVITRIWKQQMTRINSLQEQLRLEVLQSQNSDELCEVKPPPVKSQGYDLKPTEMEEVHYKGPTGVLRTTYVSVPNLPKRKRGSKMPYKCEECGKEFMQRDNMIFHIRSHTGERPYKCDLCGKDFVRESGLKLHSRVHSGEKPYKCEFCGREFTFRGTLRVHIRMHTKEAPYKCDVCGKAFKQIGCLQAHVRIHSGEKPFKCDGCGKMFRQNRSLKLHVNRKNGINPCKYAIDGKDGSVLIRDKFYSKTEIGTYQCDICGKDYIHQNSVINHVKSMHRTDKEYYCNICNQVFTNLEIYQEDKLRHQEEMQFSCNICHRKFKHQKTLKDHLRKHTGETPYKCQHCDKSFYCRSLLFRHSKIHSDVKPFKCGLCEESFRCNRELQNHLFNHPIYIKPEIDYVE